eukprot:1079573-Pelagomonas_calceolata.AAC.4
MSQTQVLNAGHELEYPRLIPGVVEQVPELLASCGHTHPLLRVVMSTPCYAWAGWFERPAGKEMVSLAYPNPGNSLDSWQ